jgi:PAS domain S-box-containing protein
MSTRNTSPIERDFTEATPVAGASDVNIQLQAALHRQEVMTSLGRRAISPPELTVLLQDAAEMAAQALGVDRFGVAEFQPDCHQHSLCLGAPHCGDEQGDIRRYDGDSNPAISIHGLAISKAKPIVSTNLAADQDVLDPLLMSQGIASALVCPLMSADHSFGAIGVYHTNPHQFTREDILFVESIAHLMTSTMARQLAEQKLAENDEKSSEAYDAVDTPVLLFTPDFHVEWVNRATVDFTGFSFNELHERSFSSAFLLPEEVDQFKEARNALVKGQPSVRFESHLLTKSGDKYRINWSFAGRRSQDGSLASIVGTGIDVSERYQLLEELSRTRSEIDRIKSTLQSLEEKIENREVVLDDVGRASESVQNDRRRRERTPYPYIQYVAPHTGKTLPSFRSFSPVRCRDISPTGFSFLAPSLPAFDSIVIAFGSAPSIIYLVADIVHTTRCVIDGEDLYIVGCRYSSRARY